MVLAASHGFSTPWAVVLPNPAKCFAFRDRAARTADGGTTRCPLRVGSSGKKQLTMSLMIRTASPTDVAWKPMPAYPATSSSTVMLRDAYWLKSMPCTSRAPSGTGSEGFKTASVAPVGADDWLAIALDPGGSFSVCCSRARRSVCGCVCVCVCVCVRACVLVWAWIRRAAFGEFATCLAQQRVLRVPRV